MGDYPRGGIIARAARTIRSVAALKIPLHAANAGFFIVLSVFPALLLMLSLLRYTHLEVGDLLELLSSILPEALWDTAEELIISTYQSTSASVVGVSAVTALWSASRGIHGLLGGLNAVYGVTETRGYFYARAISLLYTFAFLVVMLLTLGLHVFGSGLIGFLTMIDNPVLIFLVDLIDLRFFLLLILQTLVFTLMFMALPDKPNRFGESLPGGLLASTGWLIFSDLYSIYVENFSAYANVYGSVYAVALSMLWLYCCLSILFYGGVMNQYLAAEKD
jgi:membrane protein